MRVENWCGHDIRFVEQDGQWWAILKDICDALGLRTDNTAQRLDPDMMTRIEVPKVVSNPDGIDHYSTGDNSRGAKKFWMLAVNEIGIYEALFNSRRLEARKFRRWSATVLQKLRAQVGLQGYEVMRMTEASIQEDIDHILDTLFYDEETGRVMQSITVQGGDVEQVPYL